MSVIFYDRRLTWQTQIFDPGRRSMRYFLVVLFSSLVLIGCVHRTSRKGVLSQELPLTLGDLAEIRSGETNHRKILQEYKRFESPKLETYLNAIAANVAQVSTRPHLPYRVIILDSEEVNMFGGPGGFIYITRGLLNFVESEPELAGLLSHEIGHISAYEYANIPHQTKVKFVYNALLRGSELAKDGIGTYGTAVNYGIKGLGKAAPVIAQQFGHDQEILADKRAVEYLMKAGYDPRGFQKFIERLSRIPMEDVGRFVIFLNTHPPFQDRRAVLADLLRGTDFDSGKIEFKQDLLTEVRQVTINSQDSIIFEPQLGVHQVLPDLGGGFQDGKDEKLTAAANRKARGAWF